MKFILHVGTHKTGTTSLQESCALNRKGLARHGIIYPDLTDYGFNFHERHHEFAQAVASSDQADFDRMRKFVEEQAEFCGHDDIVLLSAESIYRHVFPESEANFWTGHDAYLERLARLFNGIEVEVALVFRDHCAFAQSLYQESVRAVGYGDSFDSYLNDFSVYFEYRKHVELFEAHFKTVRLFHFESLAGEELTRNFLRAIGKETVELENVARKRVGLPPHLVLYLRDQNKYLTPTARQGLVSYLFDNCAKMQRGFETFDFFGSKLREEFRAKYDDDAKWIAKRIDGRTSSNTRINKFEPGRDQLTANEVQVINSYLIENWFDGTAKQSEPPSGLNNLLARTRKICAVLNVK